MEYRQLGHRGHSGLTVSAIGLGCNAFGARIDSERTRQVVAAAIEHLISFFDTSDIECLGARKPSMRVSGAWEAVDAHWIARSRGLRGFVSAQNEYSLYSTRLSRDDQKHRLERADFARVEALEAYAAERGVALLDVALGGLAGSNAAPGDGMKHQSYALR